MLGNGESSRSLHERAKEHWADAVKGVDECLRMKHEHAAHRGEGGNPSCVWLVGADSKKNKEQNGSLYTIRSGVSVSHGIQLFSTSQGGCVIVGSILLHLKSADFILCFLIFH